MSQFIINAMTLELRLEMKNIKLNQWLCLLLVCILPIAALAVNAAPIGGNPDVPQSESVTEPVVTEAVVAEPVVTEPTATEPVTLPSSEVKNNPEVSDKRTLDDRVQALKKEVKSLNRDLFILEEELLFPSSTQVAVFLSIDVGEFFKLDSVQLKIDDKVVANHLYTKRELGALKRGGVQRLYIGNVKSGEHELIATFRGPGPNNREYRRGTTVQFKKGSAAKFMELKIVDVTQKLQPEFVVKEWE